MLRFGIVLLCVLALAFPVYSAEVASPEDTARLLAGLSVPADSPLAALAATPGSRRHAANFDAAFDRVDRVQLDKIRRWSAANITGHRATLFYFFSGPDFLYANAFFPDAETYVLAGLEASGPIPDVGKLPKRAVPQVLRSFEVALRSILGLSFFKTKLMSSDFRASQAVSGTIPVLYIFLARAGKEVHSATLVKLDANGAISSDADAARKSAAEGVKITFSSPGGPERTLYYFSANVAGGGFKTSGIETFCDKLGEGDAFIKSASYLLHGNDFAPIRNFILKQSAQILEDDSGVPVAMFDATWQLKPYGHYVGPIDLFAGRYQPRMAALYRKAKVGPIDFGIGYRYNPRESTLILAVKRQPARQDEANPASKAVEPDAQPTAQPKAKPDAKTDPKADVRAPAAPNGTDTKVAPRTSH